MKKYLLLAAIVFIIHSLLVINLVAAPPNPLVYDVGSLPVHLQKQILGPRLPLPAGFKLNESIPAPGLASTTGIARVVVILVEFTDVKHSASYTSSYFDNLLFSTSNSSSMYSYYKEVSYNQLFIDDGDGNPAVDITSNPTSWVTSSYTMANYGEDAVPFVSIDNANGNIWELAQEAVQLVDASVDFSQYDTDSDGTVDHVVIVHAGPAQESGGGLYGSDAIWSHRWEIGGGATSGYLTNDGVYVKGYTMQAESSPMGIFAHEFGHDLGLPDFYDTNTGAAGIGYWGLMDSGSWNSNGTSPAHPSAWSKVFLGWTTPEDITEKQNSLSIYPVETTQNNGNKSIYKIAVDIADDPTKEYFLISYRRQIGFDVALPGEGLLIWHVDDSVGSIADNNVNNNPNHRRLDLEGPSKVEQSDIGSAFTDGDSFSSPDNKAYNGQDSGISILGISGAGGSSIASEVYKVLFNQALALKKSINYPNPTYDGNTTISFTMTRPPTTRTIAIYNIAGELVRNVTSNDIQTQSVDDNNVVYIYSWDGKNNDGENVFSGIYIYLIKAGGEKQTGKLAIIK